MWVGPFARKGDAQMAEKTYVARRDQLRVHEGSIHTGEAFPAGDVTPSLLTLGWVREGVGTVPVDDGAHAAFAEGEAARHRPADPAAVKAFKKARAEAAAIAAGDSIDPEPTKLAAQPRKKPAAKKGAAKKGAKK